MAIGNPEYMLEFDAPSVARLEAMTTAAPMMATFYLTAMRASVHQVETRAALNAPVVTGYLRRGIRAITESPFVGRVGVINSVAYARRREFGFDNRIDALGRKFARDPRDDTYSSDGMPTRSHMFYLKRALIDSQPFINAAFRTSTRLAFNAMSGV